MSCAQHWSLSTCKYRPQRSANCTAMRAADIVKTDHTAGCRRWGATGTLTHRWRHYTVGGPFWKNSWTISYKAKHTLTMWFCNSTPWYLPKKNENICLYKGTWMFLAALFIIAPNGKQPRCPLAGEWINNLFTFCRMGYCWERENELKIQGGTKVGLQLRSQNRVYSCIIVYQLLSFPYE